MKYCTVLFFVCALVIQGCTPYGPSGVMGGYTDTVLGGGYYSVNFAGNGYTSAQRVSDLSLLRACELALRDGYAKYTILGSKGNISTDYAQTPGMATTTGSYSYGSYSSTTIYTPPTSVAIQKPDSNISIQGLPASARNGLSIADTMATIKQKYNLK